MSDAPKVATQTAHILIVDDEEGIRTLLQNKLLKEGFRVSVAGTAMHALQKLNSRNDFDLVLCDLKMPRMSGVDLFKAMTQNPGQTKRIRFIIMTAYADKTKLLEAIQAGVNGVIIKPFRHQDLMDRLTTVLAPDEMPAAA